MFGAGEESRTPDLRITNALLYQLSYTGTIRRAGHGPIGEARILTDRIGAQAAQVLSSNAGSFFSTGVFFSVT